MTEQVCQNHLTNEQVDAKNLEIWAAKPSRFGAYYTLASDGVATGNTPFRTHGKVTTWMGAEIGTVTSARVYRHNFGGRFVSLRVKANNGEEYYGRASYDGGSFVMLNKVKR